MISVASVGGDVTELENGSGVGDQGRTLLDADVQILRQLYAEHRRETRLLAAEGCIAVLVAIILGVAIMRHSVWGAVLAGLMLSLIGAIMIPVLTERRTLAQQIDRLQRSIVASGFRVEVQGRDVRVRAQRAGSED